MEQSVFVELKFWLLVLFSIVVPVGMVWACLTVKAVSRTSILTVGLALVAIAGFDVYLLQALARMSRLTPSLADDAVFDSEITVGLYVLPALLAGVGVNVTSHVLLQHLADAQRRLARRPKAAPAGHDTGAPALIDSAPPRRSPTATPPNVAIQ